MQCSPILLAVCSFLSVGFISSSAQADPQSVKELIVKHANANNVPAGLADAMVRVESRYNPRARNRANLGLTQISYATARSLGYSGGANGLLDSDTNLRFGIKYLAQAYRLAHGDTCGTVMRYQSGLRVTRMNSANRVYCGKVKAIMSGKSSLKS